MITSYWSYAIFLKPKYFPKKSECKVFRRGVTEKIYFLLKTMRNAREDNELSVMRIRSYRVVSFSDNLLAFRRR
jgi:hypothetical protein